MLIVVVEGRYSVPCTVIGGRISGVSGTTNSAHPNPRIVSVGMGLSGDTVSYGNGVDAVDVRGINGDVATVGIGMAITMIYGLLRS